LRADGADTSLLDDGVGLAGLRLMGGGQDVEFFEDITDGMQIDVTSWIEAVDLKEGTTGALLIITVLSSYTDGRARLICRCRETLIAR
jgi:hydroxyacyl-ACP dehydratase HTD2-like protein with hotdog domain